MSQKTTTSIVKSKEDSILLHLNHSKKVFENYLGSEENALRFLSSCRHCIQSIPKLLDCDKESLLGAFLECASINLFPSNCHGDCFIIPYNGMAQFQLGYKGAKTLAYRSGVSLLASEVVYENDDFSYHLGINQDLKHIPAEGDRGDPIKVYAWAKVNGEKTFNVMSKDDVMKIKNTSPCKNSKYSPWNTNDPQKWMWKKTVIKQLAKLLPTSEELKRAIYLDNISERGGYIKDKDTVVEVPFERSTVEEVTPKKLSEKFDKKKDDVKKAESGVDVYLNKLNKCESYNQADEISVDIMDDQTLSKEEKNIIEEAVAEKKKLFPNEQ